MKAHALLTFALLLVLNHGTATAQGTGGPIGQAFLRCNGSSITLEHEAGTEFEMIHCTDTILAPTQAEFLLGAQDAAASGYGCQPCGSPSVDCSRIVTLLSFPVPAWTEVTYVSAGPPFNLNCNRYTFHFEGVLVIDVQCDC